MTALIHGCLETGLLGVPDVSGPKRSHHRAVHDPRGAAFVFQNTDISTTLATRRVAAALIRARKET